MTTKNMRMYYAIRAKKSAEKKAKQTLSNNAYIVCANKLKPTLDEFQAMPHSQMRKEYPQQYAHLMWLCE